MSKNFLIIIAIQTFIVSYNIKASYTLEELAALSSGTSAGYKIAAQGAINSGGFDPWATNQGGNNEIYKNRIDPAAPNTLQAISNVKNTLAGNAGNSLLQDANNSVTAFQTQIAQRNATIITAITALDTTMGQTLPGATQAVNNIVSTGGVGGNRGADVLTDVTAARNALPNSGTGDLKARALAVGGTINTTITALDTTVGQTLPGATQAVNNAVSTVAVNRGADVLADVTTARNALPNAGAGDLKARAVAIGGMVSTAINTLDSTPGQTLPGATQAVNNIVSTSGVGGNRGADVLTDVTAARNALPNSGTGDLKARALAVQGTINAAIADIDSTKATLPAAVASIMDTQANYASVRTLAGSINANFTLNTTSDASLRNEVAILFNILQTINNSGVQIEHIDGSPADFSNITLADIINFLKNRVNLN